MKIAVIGGGGVRTPLLVRGLTASDLPLDTVALYDTDRARLDLIASLAARLSAGARVVATRSAAEAIEGADFVFTSVRAGGAAARAHDEAASIAHGIAGQETVGPAGFAMAMRGIPPLVEYAREVMRRAPCAWIVNFTNPVGIVTEAVRKATGARIIGICDTPTELFEEIAHALGVDSAECAFDYFGLNHLGWVREVRHRGEPMLARLWDDPASLARLYRAPLFDGGFLSRLRLLPTEYVYYYYRPDDALANVKRAGRSRGVVVGELNERLFAALARPGADPIREYDAYLAARNASYMQIESGAAAPLAPTAAAALTGYDRIALSVVRAIHFNSGAVIPLDVTNGGAIVDLEEDDVVEVPCVVNANGALPLACGRVPASVRDLLLEVKKYERLTVRAALEGGDALAREALAMNPLVQSEARANALIQELQR
jgi:6-phospho-beta-glucosidase